MLRHSVPCYNAASLMTLGLDSSRQWSQSEIKSAYRTAVKRHHPDAGGNPEHFKAVCAAYEKLTGKDTGTAASGSGSGGFYNHPHSRNTYTGGSSYGNRASGASYGSQWRTDRMRDDGSHGQHSDGRWANQGGASASYSTRDFYRPYEGNFAHAFRWKKWGKFGEDPWSAEGTGFTAAEMAEARNRSIAYRTYKFVKRSIVAALLVYAYILYRQNDRIAAANEAREKGYTPEYWAKVENGKPRLESYYLRKKREIMEQMTSESKRRQEAGVEKNPFERSPYDDRRAIALTYKGKPFTMEGLAAAREEEKRVVKAGRAGGVPAGAAAATGVAGGTAVASVAKTKANRPITSATSADDKDEVSVDMD